MCSYLYYMFNICLIYYIYTYISLYATREMESSLQLTSRNKKNLGFTEAPLFLYQIMNGGRYNARPWHVSPGALRSKGERSTRKNVRIEPKNHCNAFESTQRIG